MQITDTFKAYFDFSGSRRMGKVVKLNRKTLWVKVMIGAKSHVIIKRHARKHRVRFEPILF
jgi:hypothetical protein